jgi:hypothetical protein
MKKKAQKKLEREERATEIRNSKKVKGKTKWSMAQNFVKANMKVALKKANPLSRIQQIVSAAKVRETRQKQALERRRNLVMKKVREMNTMHKLQLGKEKMSTLIRYLLSQQEKPVATKAQRMWFVMFLIPELWVRCQ